MRTGRMDARHALVLRTLGIVTLVGVYLPVRLTPAPAGTTMGESRLVALVAALLLSSGLALVVWSLGTMLRWGYRTATPGPCTAPGHLVVQGPYRLVRNPSVLGVGIVLAGHLTLAPSLPLVGLLLAAVAAAHALVIGHEEPRLAQRFGRAYDAYRRAVPRWLPLAPR